jgi:hypothetical protein
MLEANPELKESRNPEALKRSFKSIQRFAPDIASDPMAAGAIAFRLGNAVVGDHDKILRDAVSLQKDHVQSQFRIFPDPKVSLDYGKPSKA